MAEGKKGFILYADIIHTVKKLPIEKRGELFTIILEYVNDQNPEVKDLLVDLVWEPIKRQLKRDLSHWDDKKAKRADAGRLGGLAKASNAKQKLANLAVKENVIDTVIVNDSVRDINVLNAFKENVVKEAKELNFNDTIYIPFLEHWTERDFESGNYAWQVPETFIIRSRLKGWKGNNDKSKPKTEKNLFT